MLGVPSGSAKHQLGLWMGCSLLDITLVLTFDKTEVKCLDLFPGPRGTPEEFQARFYARFVVETLDVDLLPQHLPAVMFDQPGEDGFQR